MNHALRIAAIIILAFCCVAPAWAAAKASRPGRDHIVYFANTPDELNVYRVYGAKGGKTLMLIGGIQGDEPGGFLSADLYADISLNKGDLIVVPRANLYSIMLNHRGPDGDMNRQFGDPVTAKRHKKIVAVLKELMAQSDLLLNLHDGSGFYRHKWEGPMANPRRYGQSLIADADSYTTPKGEELNLEAMANRVLERVNHQINNRKYHLLFNNHRTSEKNSQHKEQRRSATYYALTQCNIPAFGVETSKSLPSEAMKVRHHNLVINAFMEELGIEAENPGSYLAKPVLKFLVVSINDQLPAVVNKDGTLTVHPGDTVNILHVEANYERGLTCDVVGVGSVNDLRQPLALKKGSVVVVRKDNQKIGKIRIKVAKSQSSYTTVRSPILYFLVDVEGQRRVIARGETLRVVRGDRITLVDLLSNLANQRGIQVNFKGFVPSVNGPNAGEDRGHPINTAADLMARYSSCGGGASTGVECYRVVATQSTRMLGHMKVEVVPARMDYLVMKRDGGHKLVYYNGETIQASPGERLEVVDLKTNVHSKDELNLALYHDGKRLASFSGLIDQGSLNLKRLNGNKLKGLKLVVLRAGKAIGHIRLKIGGR